MFTTIDKNLGDPNKYNIDICMLKTKPRVSGCVLFLDGPLLLRKGLLEGPPAPGGPTPLAIADWTRSQHLS